MHPKNLVLSSLIDFPVLSSFLFHREIILQKMRSRKVIQALIKVFAYTFT